MSKSKVKSINQKGGVTAQNVSIKGDQLNQAPNNKKKLISFIFLLAAIATIITATIKLLGLI